MDQPLTCGRLAASSLSFFPWLKGTALLGQPLTLPCDEASLSSLETLASLSLLTRKSRTKTNKTKCLRSSRYWGIQRKKIRSSSVTSKLWPISTHFQSKTVLTLPCTTRLPLMLWTFWNRCFDSTHIKGSRLMMLLIILFLQLFDERTLKQVRPKGYLLK